MQPLEQGVWEYHEWLFTLLTPVLIINISALNESEIDKYIPNNENK